MKRLFKRSTLIAVTAALAALFVFSAVALAQGPVNGDGPAGRAHPGGWLGFGMGFRGAHAGPDGSLIATAADVLEVDRADLVAQLQDGKTLAEIAGDQADEIVDAFLAQRAEALQEAVDAGRLTQEQADTILGWMKDSVTQRMEEAFSPPAFVDADGDGVCDRWVDADGDGVNDLQGTFGPRKGGRGGRWGR
ncbi:MAG: hypothetical protein Kow0047_29710 [Anaerolineae bacterium]